MERERRKIGSGRREYEIKKKKRKKSVAHKEELA